MKHVIGIGTGRCGTKSLAHLLNEQEDAFVTHERARQAATHRPNITQLRRALAEVEGHALVGDVAMWWLQSVPLFLSLWGNARVVCMKRSKDATVNSWERLFNEHGDNLWEVNGGDADFFPPMEGDSIRESAARYWDHYYEHVEVLREKYPTRVAVFAVDDLNSLQGRRRIIEHAGIEPTNLSRVHENAGTPKQK